MHRSRLTMGAVMVATALGTIAGRSSDQTSGSSEPTPPALSAMAETEREFARTATVKGIRDSFLEFFANDSIAFNPAPISAKERLLKQQSHPFAVRELVWEPRTGDVASSGELGWLTGPSTFIDHGGNDKQPHYGNYLSVWRLQKDDKWRVLIDVGTSVPAPASFAPGFTRIPFESRYQGKDAKDDTTARLLSADKDLNASLSSGGPARAYAQRLTPASRLHRSGFAPMTDVSSIRDWLERNATGMTATTGSAEASKAGDFGYSYGTYEVKSSTPESGAYVRVWSRDNTGKWFVMADVTQQTTPVAR